MTQYHKLLKTQTPTVDKLQIPFQTNSVKKNCKFQHTKIIETN